MKPLTENQKDLLPKVRERNRAKNTKKSLVIVALINDYLGGKKQTRDELNAVKLAVQLYQVELKNEKLRKKEREIQSKEQKKETKDLTREKIILGACTAHIAKQELNYPYMDFLRAWKKGFLSDRDLDFMKTRLELKQGTLQNGDTYWQVSTGDCLYRLIYQPNADRTLVYRRYKKVNGEYQKQTGIYL